MEEADEVEVMDVDIEEEDEKLSFEEMGLDPRLIRTLAKKNITKPTPVQLKAIPLILEGKDVVARAKTGSGKTFAYLLPLLQKLFSYSNASKTGPSAFVLVPTRELCQQVHMEISSLLEHCKGSWKVIQLTSSMSPSDLRSAMVGSPDIIVATPACIANCIAKKILQVSSLQESLSTLVLDEADLLLSYGYEDDLRSLVPYIPRRCQCLLMSATSSADVEKIKKLVLHSPVVLTLTEVEGNMDNGVVPKSVQQFWISCEARDKLLHVLALLKLELVQKKVLIFVNSIDAGFRLKLFLEQFGIRSAVLNAELPQNSRLHLLEEFNSGLFDYLIATDDSQPAKLEKEHVEEVQHSSKKTKKHQKKAVDSEFGVVRGIDFKNVYTVINFDMPLSTSGYIHRIGRTGRAYSTGASVSLVSPEEESIFREIKVALSGSEENAESEKFIAPFPLLTKNAVESLRYRAQDIAKSVTKVAVREARASDLRNEILNSERLKAHFEDNPKDLELLKHDKVLSKKQPSSHLRAVPDYLVDPTTEAASRAVKLARVAMGGQSKPRNRGWLKKKSGRSADPLKTFSVGSKKGSWKGSSKKRKVNGSDRERLKKKDKSSI